MKLSVLFGIIIPNILNIVGFHDEISCFIMFSVLFLVLHHQAHTVHPFFNALLIKMHYVEDWLTERSFASVIK